MMKTTTKNLLRRAIMLLMVLVSFANVVRAEDFTFNMYRSVVEQFKIVVSINENYVIKLYWSDGKLFKAKTFKYGQSFGHNSDAVVSFSDRKVANYMDLNDYDGDFVIFGDYALKDNYYCFVNNITDSNAFDALIYFRPVNLQTYMSTLFSMRSAVDKRNRSNTSSSTKPTTTTTKYVDLGLSVKWATCNLGASSPEQYGNYYAWGETTKKTNYSWDTYKYGKWSDAITKYCQDKAYGKNGYSDRRTTLELTDDAARIRLGTPWRMPTAIEIRELVERCTWTRATIGGKSGYKVVGPNGNSIFLPAGGRYFKTTHGNIGEGYYWSSTLGDYPVDAQYLDFDSTGPHRRYAGSRIHGMLIRPVRP